jgi:hypothetical protein
LLLDRVALRSQLDEQRIFVEFFIQSGFELIQHGQGGVDNLTGQFLMPHKNRN